VSELRAGEPTLAGAAWRYRVMVLAAVLVFLGAGVAYAEVRGASYTATATMVLQDPHSDPVFGNANSQAPERYTADQITVLKSPQLASAAAAVGAADHPPLGLSADDFSAHTVVSGTPLNGNLVQITFSARDQRTAVAGVDAIKTAYEQTVSAAVSAQLSSLLKQIDTQLASINEQLSSVSSRPVGASPSSQAALAARRDTLNAKRDQVVVDAASGSNGVALSLPAQAATHSSKLLAAAPILALAMMLGLVLGVIAAYLRASRSRVFMGRDEPHLVVNGPLVAEIPRFDRAHPLPAATGDPAPAAASAFRAAALFVQGTRMTRNGRGDVASRRAQARAHRLVVISPKRQEGRSTVAANLGIALADSGVSTMLVDADPATGGLSQLLRRRYELKAAIDSPVRPNSADMSLENVVGPGNSSSHLTLLRARSAQLPLEDADRDERLQKLESLIDVVIIDGPPLSQAGPSWMLVRRADSALVVVNNGTPVAQVEEVARLLKALAIPAFGYIYNHGPQPRGAQRIPEATGSPVSPPVPV
jgi:Mrp family chromosome partitioning ATPase